MNDRAECSWRSHSGQMATPPTTALAKSGTLGCNGIRMVQRGRRRWSSPRQKRDNMVGRENPSEGAEGGAARDTRDDGFSFIELLVAIVLLGTIVVATLAACGQRSSPARSTTTIPRPTRGCRLRPMQSQSPTTSRALRSPTPRSRPRTSRRERRDETRRVDDDGCAARLLRAVPVVSDNRGLTRGVGHDLCGGQYRQPGLPTADHLHRDLARRQDDAFDRGDQECLGVDAIADSR